jgi:phosphatidylglycerophosphatase A
MTFYKRLATQGAIGYTAAPGTYATIMAAPTVWMLTHMQLSVEYYIVIATIFWLAGLYVVDRALPEFETHDPSEIVLDEATSFAWVFLAIVPNFAQLCLGFVLFRLFDIYKPLGIASIEHTPGALPIMLDDLLAALYSCIVLHACIYSGLI